MDVSKVNAFGAAPFLPTESLSKLVPEKSYIITRVKIVKTRFGDKLVLDDSVSVFIPDRVKKAFEETEGLFENFSNAVDKKRITVKFFGENNFFMEFIVDESCDISLDLYEVNTKGTSPQHKRVALSKL